MNEHAALISILERLSQIQELLDQLASEKKDNTDSPQFVELMDELRLLTAELRKQCGV
ncbi:hypothetical protein [Aeromonas salmonicida]|uniref:Uncharacterized protein n=1 Tax=Aeromonas salmonicida TaxID=645 RepID=A0AAX3VTF4_AERSA|nr:hypothetical protein [Aeromonas salmonicida]WHF37155.1 hypothetical protein QLQ87_01960 [Aeromonas salmonicida]